jgi:hypothetical protein
VAVYLRNKVGKNRTVFFKCLNHLLKEVKKSFNPL